MSNKVYLVFPPRGYGGNDMVIVASSKEEAEQMFYTGARMTSEYYDEARKQGCEQVSEISTKDKHIAYERQDNM